MPDGGMIGRQRFASDWRRALELASSADLRLARQTLALFPLAIFYFVDGKLHDAGWYFRRSDGSEWGTCAAIMISEGVTANEALHFVGPRGIANLLSGHYERWREA